ncbi:potassium channel family protein [Anoxybacteroides amylolyticum]|uniref:Ion channel family protein n=1 Tax=Anoxybacteroides amylolyticum TaxID=294699 RepID=A0A160F2Z7_9BACL|nr:potassium channel family protein [Anoxybacillus amylolyticus]ANB60152.1 ion channel family protein [Anoxybacillus amylolyticus]
MGWIIVIVGVLVLNIVSVWTSRASKHKYVSVENFVVLISLYVTMMIGFGLIYTILEINGYDIFTKNSKDITGEFFSVLQDSVYFSATTLLAVGYGDVIPIGAGRWLAVTEALLGYIMPAAFVVRVVIDWEKDIKKER